MIKLNEYTIDKEKEFEIELSDDNNAFDVDSHKTEGYPRIPKITLYVVENDQYEKHINKFKFVKAGENIGTEGHWMQIGRIGDEFLFQNSSWEDN